MFYLQAERQRRNQNPRLLDCLQFAYKAQITVSDNDLRQQIGFVSHHRGEEAIKSLEKLRNNLAHSQEIVAHDWPIISRLAERLERVLSRA